MPEQTNIPKLKTDPKYKDAPRYPMIYKYEGEFKENYSSVVKVMVTEISLQMSKFIKETK